MVGQVCAEPLRRGEATVAGRPTFIVETDLSRCHPAGAPAPIGGRHVRWVDQRTFLPLKMEMYDNAGALMHRYEVTKIEFDVVLPESTFAELPAGTVEHQPMLLPAPAPAEAVPDTTPARRIDWPAP